MIPEKRFLNQVQQVLARLMQPLWLLDTEGTVLLPEESRSKLSLPEFMEPGMPVAFEGKTFLMIGITPELILCADAQGAATHDCIVLAGAMVQSMGRGEAPIQSRYDVYRRVLREELTGTHFPSLWLPTPIRRTWVYFTLFFAGWSLLLWLIFRKKGQPVGGLMIGLMASNVVYQISLLVLYVCAMPHIPSYVRYSSTMNQAMMNLLSMLTLPRSPKPGLWTNLEVT